METLVRIPDAIHDALAEEVARSGRPEAEVILEALATYLRRRGQTIPRSFGLYADSALSGADAEDWLLANRRSE